MGKVDMTAAEIQRYVTETRDEACTIEECLGAIEVNEILAQVYRAGGKRHDGKVWPDTPEIRGWITQAAAKSESKRVGAEFMRRHRLRRNPIG